MACPVLVVNDDLVLGHGTALEDSGYGTQGIGLYDGGTKIVIWDDITYRNGNVPGGHPTFDEYGFSRFTWPGMVFIDHHAFGDLGDGLFYPDNLTTDDDGVVYYWTQEQGDSTPGNELVRQDGASWSVIDSTGRILNYGPAWNPYDGLLYNISTVGSDRLLEWWDPVAGYIDDRIIPTPSSTDAPVFTPDGGVWLSKPGFGTNSGLYRYDIPTDAWTSGDYNVIPPIRTDSVPIPQSDSSVLYRDDAPGEDRGIRLFPDFTWEEQACVPFTGDAPYFFNGTARVAHSPNWLHTAFIGPSLGGFGWYLWDLRTGTRWTVGRVRWGPNPGRWH